MLAARSPEIAARRFIEALGSATSCVTTQHLTTLTSYYEPYVDQTVAFADPPVSLRAPAGGPSGLLLDVSHVFAIAEADSVRSRQRWRATSRMYQYRLRDSQHTELLVYHWQPGGEFAGPDYPHLHVSAELTAQINAIDRLPIELDGLHLVTGRVSLGAVVRMLITEFGIAPRRSDWDTTLERIEHVFQDEADV